MQPAVTVIVPVYNAFEETQSCLISVLAYSPADCKILVIDDCSPVGKLAEYLSAEILADKRLHLERNKENLGFVRTCNRGMLELSGQDDVILLNSDTEVTPGWVQKLAKAAYSRPNVATVTPFTNNGTICSVPRFCLDNPLLPGYSVNEQAALIESVSVSEYPELPTCVGFCTYITRTAITALKGFDGDAFGKGYGEENDFSCRAQKLGMLDILDDTTFIYHKGNMSFGAQREALAAVNSATLRKRHPLYFDNVSKFCREFPLRAAHARILDKLMATWVQSKTASVLHVLHNGPYAERHHPVGGTERHVQDIIRAVPSVAHWSLVPTPTAYYLTAHLGYCDREFILDRAVVTLYDLLKPEFFDIVHAQHIQGFAYGELDAALRKHGNYILSLHDYNLVCPRVYMLTPDRRHCNGFECSSACSFGEEYIQGYRQIARSLVDSAQAVVCFSDTTKNYFERILGTSAPHWKIQAHGIEGLIPAPQRKPALVAKPAADAPLKVAFVGFLPQHKGSLVIEKLLQIDHLPSGVPVEWHIIGELYGKAPSHTHQHGKYDRAELASKLSEFNPHVVGILSLCPETYSLTLDETWNAGVPVLSTPLGAPAERVAATSAGWVLPEVSESAVVEALEKICADWPEYLRRRESVTKVKLIDTTAEGTAYGAFYEAARPQKLAQLSALIQFTETQALARPPVRSLKSRLARRTLDSGIRLLERLRLRVLVERLIYGLLPSKFVQDLKSLR
ncbi:MAG: glycosyltransferase [Deltaproteobacteria bacterium]|nr:glycosyltransferase [Deltaproteobacteria bacterium]